ncbi:MAG TPA: hypothetical protein VK213_13575 [Bacteroidales bacterium]|nr:hypothetical protein [Bacteroidales bacterium]
MTTGKIKRGDVRPVDDQEDRIREMVELYTMVPPSPYVIRRRKASEN